MLVVNIANKKHKIFFRQSHFVAIMEFVDIILIVWSFVTLTASFLVSATIYQYISKKPTVSCTLIDLIYRDIIVYIYLSSLATYIAIIACICSSNGLQTLTFEWSVFFSLLTNSFLNCLAISMNISGGLRLISLLNNSEQFGLQLLGPDNLAIKKVRFISISLSIVLIMLGSLFFNVYPPSFDLYFYADEVSISETYSKNWFSMIYIISWILAVIIHCSAKCYSLWINYELNQLPSIELGQIFTITKSEASKNEEKFEQFEKFTLSLDSVIVILMLLFVFLVSSLSKRSLRLYIIVPAQITFLCVIIPLYLILKNEKMKIILANLYQNSIFRIFYWCKNTSSTVCPK